MQYIKKRVGGTPLVRAHNLEKEFGLSKIYLKLEGNNPSGHREDRLAYLIIRDALSKGCTTLCMGIYGTVGGSLAFLSQYFDVQLNFYVPEKHRILRKEFLSAPYIKIIRYGKTYGDCVTKSREDAEKYGWYNANPGLQNNILDMYAFSYIAKEVYQQLNKEIDTIFCQTGNGSSISGLHLGFKQLWVNENIETIPRLMAVSTNNGNAIIESFKQGSDKILMLDMKKIKSKATKYNRNLIFAQCYNGQDALNSIYASNGKAIGITDDELIECVNLFKKLEKIRSKASNLFPVAALIKEIEQGSISEGVHVVILNDGKLDTDIRVLRKKDLSVSYEVFLEKLDEWLIQFSDPLDEIGEAVENAFNYGYVLGAYYRGYLAGIAIVSKTRFKTFFPKYHLSYIATKKNIKGRGIATQLLQKVIELTKGDLSLHVETDNKRAIQLYEKMGFRKKYYRMLYEGEVI
ncbi:MAG: pyridoxal-phosphate dependent enzyme [Candidatus Thermoplasmatota archaeon]|nr:pyridoxal-phosphate dependent enzyme [Candidatus Thermoplasmatota archaeon]